MFHGEINAAQEILEKVRPCRATVDIELSDIIKEHENMQRSKVGEKVIHMYSVSKWAFTVYKIFTCIRHY